MKGKYLLLLVFALCYPKALISQVKEEDEKKIGASLATNPLAYVTKLQFQPNFTFLDNGGKQFAFFSRIVQPSKSLGLPFIKSKNPDKFYTIYRLEAPIISQTVTDHGSKFNATGTGDFILLDAVALKSKWGIAGVGGGVLIPLGSPNVLGFGKWCAGPTGILFYNKIQKVQLSLLVQQFFSFAGDSDRPDQNFMYFQPQVTKLFRNGYFIQSFPIMKFDWENDKCTIPVNLLFGKAFAKDRSMFIGPQYVVNGPAGIKDSWTIMLNINTMFK
ncbi:MULTISPECIES: hypothetical protein [Flavobacterium]|uniref:hypothetical protein n=1 Tax=Flavobacterium TaxID=237 RepID=UPI001FCC61DE|nr:MULTISPECIES: hypothetical protein [Flavobacterium]UOK43109.1 hypothetical protein LZF87_03065 [Flavobacterium enshiense]